MSSHSQVLQQSVKARAAWIDTILSQVSAMLSLVIQDDYEKHMMEMSTQNKYMTSDSMYRHFNMLENLVPKKVSLFSLLSCLFTHEYCNRVWRQVLACCHDSIRG